MPSRTNTPSRRQLLAASSLALAGCAGCLDYASVREAADVVTGSGDSETTTGDDETTTGDGGTEDAATTETPDDRLRIAVSDGDGERDLVTGEDVASVGDVEQSRQGGYQVRMALTDEGTAAFLDGLERVGALDDPSSHEIRTYLDGERVQTARLGPDLAAAMESGEWDGRLLVRVSDREAAERLRDALESG